MAKYSLNKSLILGGLLEFNKSNVLLRSLQIKDGFKIHTCNDYGHSLEVIKEASYGIEDKVKLISKVYYKYPNISSRRFRPILDQLKEQINRLGFIPSNWDIQISCYCPVKELKSKNAYKFFETIKNNFGIKKIYLEIYPVYDYTNEEILSLNSFYKGKFKFGLID